MLITVNNKTFHADARILASIAVLEEAVKGGFATIQGYKPTTNYIKSPVINVTFTSRFSYENLLKRRLEALEGISFDDVALTDPKLTALTTEAAMELFETRKAMMVASANKTLSGVRDDAHRQAHDKFYASISEGVKVHLQTEKVDGETVLVLAKDGNPIANNVMISAIEQSRVVVEEGEYKKVNSGAPVLMTNAITKVFNSRSVSFKTFSLKEGNFDKLTISKNTLENG